MDHQEWDGVDPARSRLRALVPRIEEKLVRLEHQPDHARHATEGLAKMSEISS